MSAGRDLRAVKEYVVDMLGSVTGRKRTAALADDDGVRHLALLILILQQASGLLTAAMVGTDHPFWTVERDAGLHLPNLSHMKVNKEAVSAAQEASASDDADVFWLDPSLAPLYWNLQLNLLFRMFGTDKVSSLPAECRLHFLAFSFRFNVVGRVVARLLAFMQWAEDTFDFCPTTPAVVCRKLMDAFLRVRHEGEEDRDPENHTAGLVHLREFAGAPDGFSDDSKAVFHQVVRAIADECGEVVANTIVGAAVAGGHATETEFYTREPAALPSFTRQAVASGAHAPPDKIKPAIRDVPFLLAMLAPQFQALAKTMVDLLCTAKEERQFSKLFKHADKMLVDGVDENDSDGGEEEGDDAELRTLASAFGGGVVSHHMPVPFSATLPHVA